MSQVINTFSYLYYFFIIISGGILINARRPLTALTVKETQLEGQLRFVHSRIIANCEEIAFYQGNKRFQDKLNLFYLNFISL